VNRHTLGREICVRFCVQVKFNVNRTDNMIIQSICLLDQVGVCVCDDCGRVCLLSQPLLFLSSQLDKDLNTFAMRIKEWYSWHFPVSLSVLCDALLG
jgi:nucleolar protein 56